MKKYNYKDCKVCGKLFSPNTGNQKYCKKCGQEIKTEKHNVRALSYYYRNKENILLKMKNSKTTKTKPEQEQENKIKRSKNKKTRKTYLKEHEKEVDELFNKLVS